MQLGFTRVPQLVFAIAPNHANFTLLQVHTYGQYLNLIFVLVFLFLDYPCQSSRFLNFLGSHIIKTFFDGRPIERATQKAYYSTHECMRSGYKI